MNKILLPSYIFITSPTQVIAGDAQFFFIVVFGEEVVTSKHVITLGNGEISLNLSITSKESKICYVTSTSDGLERMSVMKQGRKFVAEPTGQQ